MAGIRVADAEVSGAVQINSHPYEGFNSGAIEVLRRRRRRASRASAAAADAAAAGAAASRSPLRGSARRGRSSRRHSRRGSRAAAGASASPRHKPAANKGTSSHTYSRAASAKSHKKMEFCVQDEASMRNPDPATRAAAIARAKELGATHIRMMLYMGDLHPCRGEEAFQRLAIYEAAVRRRRRRRRATAMLIWWWLTMTSSGPRGAGCWSASTDGVDRCSVAVGCAR